MLEIKLSVENIDYESLADLIVPILKDKSDSGELPIWAKLMFVGGGMNGDTARKIISKIPKEKLDEFTVKLINEKSSAVTDMLEEMISSKGIKVVITDVKASLK